MMAQAGRVPALPFSAEDVRKAFDSATVARAEHYVARGSVASVTWDPARRVLAGRVRGSQPKPYTVQVRLERGGTAAFFVASCTCPVVIGCKHAAAMLLQALGGESRTRPATGAASAPALVSAATDRWLDALGAVATQDELPEVRLERVLYILGLEDKAGRPNPSLTILAGRPRKSGGYGKTRPYTIENVARRSAQFVTPDDALVALLLTDRNAVWGSNIPSDPRRLDIAFRWMLATGRCHFGSPEGVPLGEGPDRPGRLGWTTGALGTQVPTLETEDPGCRALALASPWYVDPAKAVAGRLRFDPPAALVAAFLRGPPLPAGEAGAVRALLAARGMQAVLPPPAPDPPVTTIADPPVPVLRLATETIHTASGYGYRAAETSEQRDIALLALDYGGVLVPPNDGPEELRRFEAGRIIVHRKHRKAERQALGALTRLRFHFAAPSGSSAPPATHLRLGFGGPEAWRAFVHGEVPPLVARGWRVEFDPSFRHRVVEPAEEWVASLGEKAGWWFSLELGVDVEGTRVSLLPLLVDLVRRMRTEAGRVTLEGETVFAPLPDGRVLALPTARVRPLLETLIELHDGVGSGGGTLDISLGEAEALAAIADATRLRLVGDTRLIAVAKRLSEAGALGEAETPAGLTVALRPYQRHGLAWLGRLREHELGGVLADDMGLGKTIQTLAHLLAEKQAGRLDAPALVVCPTSLVANWEHEAARFAPGLRVLSLQGKLRASGFRRIADADLVISTYSLLPRDAETLLPVEWSVVVLDEAQAIKNPTSKATQLACRLRGRHRVCLTGTPIENHLGELWSQFAFLMPGLLGDSKRFTRVFRTPIEKRGDADRRAALASRLRPFLLRRTKEQVAPELPARSEITRHVALSGEQRDLYETVRLAMHERIRQEIAERGFERSRIVVLDALLKLRQVCCDPRLVKLSQARRVRESAKLAYLLEALPQLVDEGRRVLLFSQFTSMLDLIRPELERLGIPFVELRGNTTDRATPVARFQAGEVPLFLISLKSGGFGLNLTAADSVILYDPWWNPAVERQAADRAHRIGQDKPVFVYRLIAEGTIEERMLELQQRKSALAGGLLDDEGGGFTGFAQTDLEMLLRPIG